MSSRLQVLRIVRSWASLRMMSEICRYTLLQTFAEHRQALMRFLACRLGNPALASHLAHEIWLRIAHKPEGGLPGTPRSHLFRIASRVASDHQNQTAPDGRFEPTPRISHRNVVPHRSEFARLVRVIDALPPRCREVFLLCRFEGLSHAEVARRLGIDRATVVHHMVSALMAVEGEMDAAR